jgi:hypothetical protein
MSEDNKKYTIGVDIPAMPPITDHTFTLKSAYIPTPFVVPPALKVGDKWYIKYQQGFCGLTEVEIKEVTEKTVVLQSLDKWLGYERLDKWLGYERGESKPVRYKKSDIEFVEKV